MAAALSSPAAADDLVDWPGRTRAGLTYGFDAGVGGMSVECVDGCGGAFDPAVAVSAHVGGMLRPCLALVYDGWLLVNRSEDSAFGDAVVLNSLHTAAMQGWIMPRVWLRGGIGLANLRVRLSSIGTRDETVPGFSAAAGFEVVSGAALAVDVSLRVGVALADDGTGQDEAVRNVAVAAGMSWY